MASGSLGFLSALRSSSLLPGCARQKRSYSSQVTCVLPIQNDLTVTWCWGPSSLLRPFSVSGLPIVKVPPAIGTISKSTAASSPSAAAVSLFPFNSPASFPAPPAFPPPPPPRRRTGPDALRVHRARHGDEVPTDYLCRGRENGSRRVESRLRARRRP